MQLNHILKFPKERFMKKITYLLILVQFCFLNHLTAQLEKGGLMLDGSIFLGFDDEDETLDFTSISTPTVGYFVVDNFLLGAGLELRTAKENRIQGDASTRQFNFKPFVRYYFGNNKLKTYGQLDLETANFKFKGSNFKQKQSFTDVYLRVGFDYFLSPNVALESDFSFRLGENLDYLNASPDELRIDIGQEARTSLSLGFKFFLNNQTEKGATTATESLVNRYLKKGNQTIGLNGIGLVADGNYFLVGGVTWQKFTGDKQRWSHDINTLMTNSFSSDESFTGSYAYRPAFEPFIAVVANTYFVPSLGVNLGVALSSEDNRIFFGGAFHPRLVHFFNNVLLEIGLDAQTPITDFDEELCDWSGQMILAGEYFIQNNLSVRGEINVRAFGEANIQEFEEFFIYQYNPKSRFLIGFNYFFNKGNRAESEEKID